MRLVAVAAVAMLAAGCVEMPSAGAPMPYSPIQSYVVASEASACGGDQRCVCVAQAVGEKMSRGQYDLLREALRDSRSANFASDTRSILAVTGPEFTQGMLRGTPVRTAELHSAVMQVHELLQSCRQQPAAFNCTMEGSTRVCR